MKTQVKKITDKNFLLELVAEDGYDLEYASKKLIDEILNILKQKN